MHINASRAIIREWQRILWKESSGKVCRAQLEEAAAERDVMQGRGNPGIYRGCAQSSPLLEYRRKCMDVRGLSSCLRVKEEQLKPRSCSHSGC